MKIAVAGTGYVGLSIDDIEGSPYYGRTKQFVNIK